MAELAGLLDRARTKIRGLLGDFPQGFNAGAAAGVAGWPGDIAYGIDTARLALTGADTQAPPEQFPGTTDYIAAQAGYPIPQTLSGQIGGALGGMLTPGPGDLARLAPLGAMFLPARAAGANRKVLELAMAMHSEGKNADEIRQVTGAMGQPWSLGRDGIWRFEISDADARPRHLSMGELPREQSMYTLSDFLDHPALFEADPTLADTPVRLSTYQNRLLPSGSRGQVSTEIGPDLTLRPVITLSDLNWVDKGNVEATLEPLLHEPMHVIQQKYGLASGGSPSEFAAHGPVGSNRLYRSLAGEDEAFNVWRRWRMTMPERIDFGPELTAPVPYEQQIVRFGGGGASMEPPPQQFAQEFDLDVSPSWIDKESVLHKLYPEEALPKRVRVMKNPTPEDARRLLDPERIQGEQLRVLYDEETGDRYFWNSADGMHRDVREALFKNGSITGDNTPRRFQEDNGRIGELNRDNLLWGRPKYKSPAKRRNDE